MSFISKDKLFLSKYMFFTIIILATYLMSFCNLVHQITYTFVVCTHEIEVK
jgi:ABC-type transport system involved in multi-copper enzyme maturation permease subunit